MFDPPIEEDDNLLGYIPGFSAGEDYQHQMATGEPQMVQEYGHEFALLDWGDPEPQESLEPVEEEEPEPKEDKRKLVKEKEVSSPGISYKRRMYERMIDEEDEEYEDEMPVEEEQPAYESKKSKKKKDKKKGKKSKHDKPIRHEEFGDFEDHFQGYNFSD